MGEKPKPPDGEFEALLELFRPSERLNLHEYADSDDNDSFRFEQVEGGDAK